MMQELNSLSLADPSAAEATAQPNSPSDEADLEIEEIGDIVSDDEDD